MKVNLLFSNYWSKDIQGLTYEKYKSFRSIIAQEIGIPKDQDHEFCLRVWQTHASPICINY